MIKHAAHVMKDFGWGSIVAISRVAGILFEPWLRPYSPSPAALESPSSIAGLA